MDKSRTASGESSITSTTNTTAASATSSAGGATNRDQYLRHLNKLSHKISKPIIKKPPFENTQNQNFNNQNQQQPPASAPQSQAQPQNLQAQQQQQHQPPVYNINKNDFRDVVQKLTGSPAHDRFSAPPPIQPPKPPSSRLQRIRPPPLAHVSNRPPPLLNSAVPSSINPNPQIPNFAPIGRAVTPLSPLPPFPSVHAAAESPVSAYMRYLQSSNPAVDSNPKQFSGFSPLAPLVSSRWNNPIPPPPTQQQNQQFPPPPPGVLPSPTSGMLSSQSQSQSQFPMPSSPLPFGCLNSPRSPYPLLSPSLLFSPASGQLGFPQFPLSPRVPVPSPRWRDL